MSTDHSRSISFLLHGNPPILDQSVQTPHLSMVRHQETGPVQICTTDWTGQDFHTRLDKRTTTDWISTTKGYRAGQRNEQFFSCDFIEKRKERERFSTFIQTAIIVLTKRMAVKWLFMRDTSCHLSFYVK